MDMSPETSMRWALTQQFFLGQQRCAGSVRVVADHTADDFLGGGMVGSLGDDGIRPRLTRLSTVLWSKPRLPPVINWSTVNRVKPCRIMIGHRAIHAISSFCGEVGAELGTGVGAA
jgi:hypothetical protein